MTPARVFARLNPSVVSVESNTGGGGKGIYTYDTCIALCAGLPEHVFKAALVKWGADQTSTKTLEVKLYAYILMLAKRDKWVLRNSGQRLRRMAWLAPHELLKPGLFQPEISATVRAVAVGIDDSNWSRVWRHRYESVWIELDGWRGQAWSHVAYKLESVEAAGIPLDELSDSGSGWGSPSAAETVKAMNIGNESLQVAACASCHSGRPDTSG